MRRTGLDDRGAVTAEFAVVLPAVVLVLALGLGALSAGAAGVRLQHAAAESARLFGRGDDAGARAVVARVGATVGVTRTDALVCVDVTATPPVPLPLGPLAARSCALDGGG
ncbi:TadE family type IV pilus minor pilin [Microbacterium sp. RURRCA19A]|uniref:TadE family type IV pilus minor pilin n=1 Tax=Microbacterium sp. RURRCA19A TaxID=1907391 RepID=UPI00095584F7|nr:TadE family type IV pilus minor pilin [Microbacterium sp. RURRCA19A]SIS11444.1 hypothetical protein SAMN05880568_2876 [Microbacterium sp. RURRCA19A]